jgi:flagellar basal-body rod protein FlgC
VGLFDSLNISASGLTAERLRMDVIANNIANANTTRAAEQNGVSIPYQRQIVSFTSVQNNQFSTYLDSQITSFAGNGVRVASIEKDQINPFKWVYDPSHPDAIKDRNSPMYGYVRYPNVDLATEMVDLISASRSYEANVTAINAEKSMAMKALEIGRG